MSHKNYCRSSGNSDLKAELVIKIVQLYALDADANKDLCCLEVAHLKAIYAVHLKLLGHSQVVEHGILWGLSTVLHVEPTHLLDLESIF
jgi:hypothetical protein